MSFIDKLRGKELSGKDKKDIENATYGILTNKIKKEFDNLDKGIYQEVKKYDNGDIVTSAVQTG